MCSFVIAYYVFLYSSFMFHAVYFFVYVVALRLFPNSSAVRVLVGFKGVTIPRRIVRLQAKSGAGKFRIHFSSSLAAF